MVSAERVTGLETNAPGCARVDRSGRQAQMDFFNRASCPSPTEEPYDYFVPFHGVPEKWLPVGRDHPPEGHKENLVAAEGLHWILESALCLVLGVLNIRRRIRPDAGPTRHEACLIQDPT